MQTYSGESVAKCISDAARSLSTAYTYVGGCQSNGRECHFRSAGMLRSLGTYLAARLRPRTDTSADLRGRARIPQPYPARLGRYNAGFRPKVTRHIQLPEAFSQCICALILPCKVMDIFSDPTVTLSQCSTVPLTARIGDACCCGAKGMSHKQLGYRLAYIDLFASLHLV